MNASARTWLFGCLFLCACSRESQTEAPSAKPEEAQAELVKAKAIQEEERAALVRAKAIQKDRKMNSKVWKEIAPREIPYNMARLFGEDWMVVAAGNKEKANLMTIGWGSIGRLWSKDVVTIYVSPSRYTFDFLQKNDHFTVSHFPEAMRDKLAYLGRFSGRDEDKVAGAHLTAEWTELGNPRYAESDFAIECKKIYATQFDASLLQQEQIDWYKQRGIDVHYMYIGEIVHIWQK